MTTTVSFAGDEPTKEIPTVALELLSLMGFLNCGFITPEEYKKVAHDRESIFFQEMFWIKLK